MALVMGLNSTKSIVWLCFASSLFFDVYQILEASLAFRTDSEYLENGLALCRENQLDLDVFYEGSPSRARICPLHLKYFRSLLEL